VHFLMLMATSGIFTTGVGLHLSTSSEGRRG
jgi:hypothetical protein